MQKNIKKNTPDEVPRYDLDFYNWTREQMEHLRKKEYEKLDITHLLEEIESLGNSARDSMENYFVVMLVHLLKWDYQPIMQCNSWKSSIAQSKMRIERIIQKNPSLKKEMAESFEWAYQAAKLQASSETGLEIKAFPKKSPWTVEELFPDLFKKMKRK